jgi:hypothetical protein
LEDGEFDSAEKYAERVLDKDPECGEAYLYKLMVQLNVKKVDELGEGSEVLTGNKLYQKALRFGSEELRRGLEMCNSSRIEKARCRRDAEEQQRHLKQETEERLEFEGVERKQKEVEIQARANADESERPKSVLFEVEKEVEDQKSQKLPDQKPTKLPIGPYIFLGLLFAFGLYLGVIDVVNGVRKPARVEAAAKAELERLEEMERRRLAAKVRAAEEKALAERLIVPGFGLHRARICWSKARAKSGRYSRRAL